MSAAPTIRPLVAGNWKMNGLKPSLDEAQAIAAAVRAGTGLVDVMLCPPATILGRMGDIARGTGLRIGGQDCHFGVSGAHTGDISAEMLKDAGAEAVILGHSERRGDHGELDRMVRSKAEAAFRAGLVAIVCVGETEGQRQAGLTLDVVGRQLAGSLPDGANASNTVVAYEPVWAIGTGKTATPDQAQEVHAFIRGKLAGLDPAVAAGVRILYGGSMNPGNAAELLAMADIDGGLIGGASLKPDDFLAIGQAANA